MMAEVLHALCTSYSGHLSNIPGNTITELARITGNVMKYYEILKEIDFQRDNVHLPFLRTKNVQSFHRLFIYYHIYYQKDYSHNKYGGGTI